MRIVALEEAFWVDGLHRAPRLLRTSVSVDRCTRIARRTSRRASRVPLVPRMPTLQEDGENDRTDGQQRYDRRAADEGNIVSAEAGGQSFHR